MHLVAGSIPGRNLCERYTFAMGKSSNRVIRLWSLSANLVITIYWIGEWHSLRFYSWGRQSSRVSSLLQKQKKKCTSINIFWLNCSISTDKVASISQNSLIASSKLSWHSKTPPRIHSRQASHMPILSTRVSLILEFQV